MSEEDSALIETGLALIEVLEHHELSIAELIDRIELLTRNPTTQRAIIEKAIAEGLIERDGKTIRPQSPSFLRFEADVRSKEGEFSCRRCGAALTTGHFIQLGATELGAFGSTCIRKITGRE